MTTPIAVSAEAISKRFGATTALDGIDLEVPSGTVQALLGPNGAGKTTLVRILATVLRPERGTATVLGRNVITDPRGVRDVIGLAGQYAAVDENLTGTENLVMIGRLTHQRRDLHHQRAAELLAQFGLVEAADRPVRTYSGGMRRRLDLAAALVHRPPLLFLDEPTTGLDPRARQDLWRVIENLVGDGTTVLLTTQYLEEADRLADRIAIIDRGTIIAEGTPAQLKGELGSTVVELTFATTDLAAEAARTLTLFGETFPDGSHLEVRAHNGARAVADIVRQLDAHGLCVESITTRAPSLDDVFLHLTDQPVRPTESATP